MEIVIDNIKHVIIMKLKFEPTFSFVFRGLLVFLEVFLFILFPLYCSGLFATYSLANG
jgi:hypothetical protein